MTRESIIEQLRETMKDSSPEPIDWDTLNASTTIGSLGFDSLSILDLIYDVQQAFEVDFEAEAMVNISTVGDLADFLEEALKA